MRFRADLELILSAKPKDHLSLYVNGLLLQPDPHPVVWLPHLPLQLQLLILVLVEILQVEDHTHNLPGSENISLTVHDYDLFRSKNLL